MFVKCRFDSKQEFFWLEASEWFRAHYRFNQAAKFDDDPYDMQEKLGALKKAVPEEYLLDVRLVAQSVFQAFNIVQCKELGVDTEGFPKGGRDGGTDSREERKKRTALYLLKHGSALWSPQVDAGLQQAIKENDIEFFRRDIPETLNNRRKVVCFNPDEPERGILPHWLVSFWCPGDYWPTWADRNLPPLCLFTDEAAADFLSGVFHPVKTTFHAVRQCRKRLLGLKQFRRSTELRRIHKVVSKRGLFPFYHLNRDKFHAIPVPRQPAFACDKLQA